MRTIRGLRYPGGKNAATGMAGWVANQLPYEYHSTYVEPFAGMLSVLLAREAVHTEIANDADGRVSNWWHAVRDYPDELYHATAFTPYSEADFLHCKATINEGGVVERARKFAVMLNNSFSAKLVGASVGIQFTPHTHTPLARTWERWMEDCHLVAKRLRNVQLLNRDALKIMERLINEDKSVVYCDPPYPTRINAYGEHTVDYDKMSEILVEMKGMIAVSGVDEEWDHLGWVRNEKKVKRSMNTAVLGKVQADDVEVLWTNYDPREMEDAQGVQYELV